MTAANFPEFNAAVTPGRRSAARVSTGVAGCSLPDSKTLQLTTPLVLVFYCPNKGNANVVFGRNSGRHGQ